MHHPSGVLEHVRSSCQRVGLIAVCVPEQLHCGNEKVPKTSQKPGFGKVWEVLGSFWEVNRADAAAESVFGKLLGSVWEVMGRFVQASQTLTRCFGKYGFPSYGNLTFWEGMGSYGTFCTLPKVNNFFMGTHWCIRLLQSSQG
jgi:hypothetical protein